MATEVRPPSKASMDEAYRVLARAVGALTDGRSWADLLDVAARHSGRSVTELLAIAQHRPDATQVASYDQWIALGRHVRKGERGFAMLTPDLSQPDGLRYSTVFDITQTDGRAVAAAGAGQVTADRAAYLLGVFALADGMKLRIEPGLVGRMDVDGAVVRSAPDNHPHQVGLAGAVQVARAMLGSPAALADLEAASVCHIVAARFGITAPQRTFPDPARWATAQDPAEPHVALTSGLARVIAVADQLSDRIVTSQQQPSAPVRAAAPSTATSQAAAEPVKAQPVKAGPAKPVVEVAAPAKDLTPLLEAHKVAAEFFAGQLPGADAAHAYLRSRGLRSATSDPLWQLGFAPPGGHALLDHLRKNGFSDQVLLDAGVVVPRTTTGELRDRWINRLMFPIHDLHQQVIGFTGRDLSGGNSDRIPKWLNSATGDLFAKSQVLYGLGPQLIQSIPDGSTVQVAIVEGPADVIAARAAYAGLQPEGTFTIAVAPCGTAFTQPQFDALVETLGDRQSRLVVAFDSDAAGAKAFDRAYDMVCGWPGPAVGLSGLPTKDIAELVGRDGAESALLSLLAAERPLPILAIEHRLNQVMKPGFDAARVTENAVAAYKAVADLVFQAGEGGHHMLAVELIADRIGVPLNQVVEGVTTAYEQKHDLFEPDSAGPGPPVKVAASAFAAATGEQPAVGIAQQHSPVSSRVVAAARR